MSELPTSWAWSTIGDLSQYIQRGKSPKYADKSDLPVINQKCIRWNELQVQHLKFIHPDQYSAWDLARYIAPGDILWNSTGTGTVGRAYQVNESDCVPPKVVDSHVTIVRHIPAIDARYLFNWIKGPLVQGKIEEMCDGTTNQIELSRTAIAATAIPVAPAAEQTRIANQLDTLLARVQACNDRFDAIPALLKRFRQTVLRAATSGDLTVDWRRNNFGVDAASDFTEVRVGDPYSHAIRAPKVWKESSLGAACDFVGGSQPPKSTFTYENGDDLVRLIQIRDYKSDRHTTYIPKKLARRFCNKTDVMIGRYGPPIFQILRGLEGAYNVALMKAVPRTKDIDLEYLYVFLRGDQLLKFIEAGSDRTAGQDGVRKELLTPYPIFLPLLSEQAEIVRRVEALFALADRIEARCTTARAQAQRLSPLVLAKAFRGELVAQDLQDEPASVLLQRITGAAVQPAKAQTVRGQPRAKKNTSQPLPLVTQPNWAALPDGAWAAPADPEGHASVALLVAVLKAWGCPALQVQARLAILMCQQPRLFIAVLSVDQGTQWRRLVGTAADPLPAQVASFQPATNNQWRRAIAGMRARGDLIESGSGPQATWALGPGGVQIETAGWPDGRAMWVVAHLQTFGVEAILPALEPAAREFVNVKAAA